MKIRPSFYFFKSYATRLTILSLITFSCGLFLNAAVTKVVPTKARSELILETQTNLSSVRTFDYSQLRMPFAPIPVEVVEEVEEIVEPVIEVVEEKTLTQDEVLQLVSIKIKAKGFINVGGKPILLLSNGVQVAEGTVIPVRLQGDIYEITLDNFSDRGFLLTLGQASLLQTLAK